MLFNNTSKLYLIISTFILFFSKVTIASLITRNLGKQDLEPGFRVRYYKPSFDGTPTDAEMKTYLMDRTYEADAEFLGQMNGITSTAFKYLRGHIDFINGFYIDPEMDGFIVEYRGYFAPSFGGKLGLRWAQNRVEMCPGTILISRQAWAYVELYNEVFLNDTVDQTTCTWETSNRNGGRSIYSGYNNVGVNSALSFDKMYAHQLYPFRLVFYNKEESFDATFQYYDDEGPSFQYSDLIDGNSFHSVNDNYEYRDANANAGWSKICPKFDVVDTMTTSPQPPFVTQPYTCPVSSTLEISSSTSELPITSTSEPPFISSSESSLLSSTEATQSTSTETTIMTSDDSSSSVPSSGSTINSMSSFSDISSSTEVHSSTSTISDESSLVFISTSTNSVAIETSFSDSSTMDNIHITTSTFTNLETSTVVHPSIIETSTIPSSFPSTITAVETSSNIETCEIILSSSSAEETGTTMLTLSSSRSKTDTNEGTGTVIFTHATDIHSNLPTQAETGYGTAMDSLQKSSQTVSPNTEEISTTQDQSVDHKDTDTKTSLQQPITDTEHYQTIITKKISPCASSSVTGFTTTVIELPSTNAYKNEPESMSDKASIEPITTMTTNTYLNADPTGSADYEFITMSQNVVSHTEVTQWPSSTASSSVASIEQFFNQADRLGASTLLFGLLTFLL